VLIEFLLSCRQPLTQLFYRLSQIEQRPFYTRWCGFPLLFGNLFSANLDLVQVPYLEHFSLFNP